MCAVTEDPPVRQFLKVRGMQGATCHMVGGREGQPIAPRPTRNTLQAPAAHKREQRCHPAALPTQLNAPNLRAFPLTNVNEAFPALRRGDCEAVLLGK